MPDIEKSATVALLEQLAAVAVERVKATQEYLAARQRFREVEDRHGKLVSDLDEKRSTEGLWV